MTNGHFCHGILLFVTSGWWWGFQHHNPLLFSYVRRKKEIICCLFLCIFYFVQNQQQQSSKSIYEIFISLLHVGIFIADVFTWMMAWLHPLYSYWALHILLFLYRTYIHNHQDLSLSNTLVHDLQHKHLTRHRDRSESRCFLWKAFFWLISIISDPLIIHIFSHWPFEILIDWHLNSNPVKPD